MKSYHDTDGFYLDNADVGGVAVANGVNGEYLNGILNGPITDLVFRAIAKPFQGDYRSANKQFIAPLPIPDASPEDRADIAARARALQTGWTRRRDLKAAAARLSVLARARRSEHWLWPDLLALSDLEAAAPRTLRLSGDRRDWAKARLDESVAVRCEALQAHIDGGARMEAGFDGEELRLFAGGATVLDRIYLDPHSGRLTEAWWRWLLLGGGWREAERFAAELRRPPDAEGPAAEQFIAKVAELAAETAAVMAGELAMNSRLYDLYRLTAEERELVEGQA